MSNEKEKILKMWKRLPDNKEINPEVFDENNLTKSGFSTKGDGIRITGSDEFICQVLSNLKSLLAIEESSNKRLKMTMLSIRDSDGNETGGHQLYMCAVDRFDNPLELTKDGKKKSSKYDGSSITPREYYKRRQDRLDNINKVVSRFPKHK